MRRRVLRPKIDREIAYRGFNHGLMSAYRGFNHGLMSAISASPPGIALSLLGNSLGGFEFRIARRKAARSSGLREVGGDLASQCGKTCARSRARRLAVGARFRPDLGVFGVEAQPFFESGLGVRLDCIDRAFRLANTAIDAFVRVDDEHILALVEAVHGTHLDAVHVFALDAFVVDDVGQLNAVYPFTVSSRCRRRRLNYRNSIRSGEGFLETLFKRLFKAVAFLVLFRVTVLFKLVR